MCCTGLDVLIDCVFPVREGNEKSYQLLRDSLDLYLTINPDNVQYLLLQARLYFHLGIWPEKVGMRTNLFCRLTDSRLLWRVAQPLVFCPRAAGSGHPAAHSGAGPLPARGRGLPGPAHAGTHPAQEAPGYTRGEEAQRSGAPGGPVRGRSHHETQEVRLHFFGP